MPPTKWLLYVLSALLCGWYFAPRDLPISQQSTKAEHHPSTSPSLLGNRVGQNQSHSHSLPETDFDTKAALLVAGNKPQDWRVRAFFYQWAEQDPEGMITWAKKPKGLDFLTLAWQAWGRVDFSAAWEAEPSSYYQSYIVSASLTNDPTTVIAYLEGHREDEDLATFERLALQYWAERDGNAALAYMENVAPDAWEVVFNGIAEQNPQRGLDLMKQMHPEDRESRQRLVVSAARKHPDWALLQMDTLDTGHRNSMLRLVSGQKVKEDPLEAIALAEMIEDDWEQNRAKLELLFYSWEFDPNLGINILEKSKNTSHFYPGIPGVSDDDFFDFALGSLALTDPDRAFALADGRGGQAEVLRVWKKQDLSAAANALNAIWTSGYIRYQFMEQLSREEKMTLATELPEGLLQEDLADELLHDIINVRGHEGSLRWAETKGSKPVLQRMWSEYVQTMPVGDDIWDQLSQIREPEHQTVALAGMINGFAEAGNIGMVVGIFETNPDLLDETNMVGNFARTWISADPEALGEWVAGLPESVAKQEATHEIFHHLSDLRSGDYDPAHAIQWLATQPLPTDSYDMRESSKAMFAEWLNIDESAAISFLQEMDGPLKGALEEVP